MNINIEKIREDGVKLDIRIYLNDRGEFKVSDIGLKPKGKRKFTYLFSGISDYAYRSLNMEERRVYKEKVLLKECSREMLMEAVEEAWISLKPKELNV